MREQVPPRIEGSGNNSGELAKKEKNCKKSRKSVDNGIWVWYYSQAVERDGKKILTEWNESDTMSRLSQKREEKKCLTNARECDKM